MAAAKKPWLSKTLLSNALVPLLVLFYAPAAEFISANPLVVAVLWSGVNMLLRLVTKERVSLGD